MAERFPELLTTRSGETIRTAEDFECFKKPELKALFSAFEYGEVPKRQLTGFEISAEEILPYAEKKTVQLDCEGFRFETRLYLPLSQKSLVAPGMPVRVADREAKVSMVFQAEDAVEVIATLPEDGEKLAPGTYDVEIITETVRPISFLFSRDTEEE